MFAGEQRDVVVFVNLNQVQEGLSSEFRFELRYLNILSGSFESIDATATINRESAADEANAEINPGVIHAMNRVVAAEAIDQAKSLASEGGFSSGYLHYRRNSRHQMQQQRFAVPVQQAQNVQQQPAGISLTSWFSKSKKTKKHRASTKNMAAANISLSQPVTQAVPQQLTTNAAVEEATEVLKDSAAEQDPLEKARAVLNTAVDKISATLPLFAGNDDLRAQSEALITDLQQCLENMQSRAQYDQIGTKVLSSNAQRHWKQRANKAKKGYTVEKEMYQTTMSYGLEVQARSACMK
jgi:hypothetical protein